jgi:RNA polymerase sigma-70 factor (ECF subfamily)
MRTNVNHADADDLFQATALRTLEKAEQFEPGTRFDNWAFTIAASIWNNELRARKVRLGNGVVDADEANLTANNLTGETNIFASEVLKKVSSLPEGQRMAILLVYVEGYSYRETAEILGVPIGTIMSRLATGRQSLKTWAEQENAAETPGIQGDL